MTNQFSRDLNLQSIAQATDITSQPEQLSNEELEGVVAGASLPQGPNIP
jgi:hypothetical protein